MRTHKVFYEVMITPKDSIKVTQFMTQMDLADLLMRDNVRLITVNAGTPYKAPRKRKPTKSPDPIGLVQRQERRYLERIHRKGGEGL